MAQKTLSIVIDTKLTGEASYDKLKTALDGTGVSIKSFNSTLITSGENIGQWVNKIQLASDSLNKLRSNSATLGATLGAKFNVSPISNIQSDPFKDEKKSLEELLFTYRQNSAKLLSEMNNRLTLMKSIRQNGANDIKTLEIRAAQEEELIRQNSSNRLLAIEQSLRDGVITSVRDAERQRAAIIRQSLTEINNVRKAFEREENKIEARTAKVAVYKDETAQLVAELNRRIALERAIHQHGADSAIVSELRVANEQIAIRERLSKRLLEIQNSINSGTRVRDSTGRFTTADAERLKAIAQAERELLGTHNNLASATENLSTAHKHFAVHILEIIGLYRIYNALINTVISSIQAVPKVGIELESSVASFTATAGSAAGMIAIMQSLHQEAERTGIAIGTLRETFRGFQASTSLAGEELNTSWRIFTNLNTVITGLHLSTEKASGIFNALAQIFNKNKVQSEELVKQLGNLIPGAFASFAAANRNMFKSSEELIAKMKQGVVFAHDTVDNFARFLADRFAPSFALANRGLNAELGRMKTAFTELGEAIYGLTSGLLIDAVRQITSLANALRDATRGTNDLGKSLEFVGVILGSVVIGSFATFALGLKTAAGATAGLAGSVGIMARIGAGLTALGVAATAAFFGPTAIIAGLIAGAYYFHKWATTADRDQAIIKDALDSINAKVKETKPEPIEIQVDKDPLVTKIKAALDLARKNVATFQRDINSGAERITLNGETKDLSTQLFLAKEQVKTLGDALERERERAKEEITLNLNPDQALRDLAEVREKIEILFLQASGKTREAAQKQFDVTNRESLALIKNQITLLSKQEEEWKVTISKGLSKTQVIPTEVDAFKKAQEGLETLRKNREAVEQYEVARANAGSKANNQINKSYELLTTRLKGYITDLTTATNEAIALINFRADSQRNAAELSAIKNNPTSQRELIQSDFALKRAALNEQLKLTNEIIRATQDAQTSQRNYAIGTFRDIETAWKKIIQIESRDNPGAVSPTGALGRAQIQPSTLNEYINVPANILALEVKAKELRKKGKNLTAEEEEVLRKYALDNEQIIDEKAFNYYKSLVDKFEGNFVKAAAAYNSGPNLRAFSVPNFADLVPKETQNYIESFLNLSEDSVKGIKVETGLQNDLNKAFQERLKLQREIDLNYQQENIALAKINKEQLDFITELNARAFDASGQTAQAEMLRLGVEYQNQFNDLVSKGAIGEAELLKKLFARQNVEIQLNESQRKANLNLTNLTLREQQLTNAVQAGLITQQEGAKDLIEIRREQLEIYNEELRTLNEQIRAGNNDLKLQERLLEVKQQIAAIPISGAARQLNQTEIPSFLPDFETSKANLTSDKGTELNKLNSEYFDLYGFAFTAHEDYINKKTALDDKYSKASFNNQANLFKGIFSLGSDTFLSLTTASQKMYGEQSKQARAAFAAYKAMKIAETVMATAQAVMNALATSGNIYVGIALAALAGAMGAVQVATIASQPMPAAHGGLDNVPKEQTYLLDKGERVLSPNQNRDLTRFLKEPNAGNSNQQSQQPQNIRIINTLDSSSMDNYLGSDSAERIIRNYIRQEVA